jgi:hypothetical protein
MYSLINDLGQEDRGGVGSESRAGEGWVYSCICSSYPGHRESHVHSATAKFGVSNRGGLNKSLHLSKVLLHILLFSPLFIQLVKATIFLATKHCFVCYLPDLPIRALYNLTLTPHQVLYSSESSSFSSQCKKTCDHLA